MTAAHDELMDQSATVQIYLTWRDYSHYLSSDRLEHAHIIVVLLLLAYGHETVILPHELLQKFVKLGDGESAHRVFSSFHALARKADLEQVSNHDGLVKVRLYAYHQLSGHVQFSSRSADDALRRTS